MLGVHEYNVHCTLYSLWFRLCQCTMYSVQCTSCTVYIVYHSVHRSRPAFGAHIRHDGRNQLSGEAKRAFRVRGVLFISVSYEFNEDILIPRIQYSTQS